MQKTIKTPLRIDNHKIHMKKKSMMQAPDPFARPVKSPSTEEIKSSEVEEDVK